MKKAQAVKCAICRWTIDAADAVRVQSLVTPNEPERLVCRPSLTLRLRAEGIGRPDCFGQATCTSQHHSIASVVPFVPGVYPIRPGTAAWYELLAEAGA